MRHTTCLPHPSGRWAVWILSWLPHPFRVWKGCGIALFLLTPTLLPPALHSQPLRCATDTAQPDFTTEDPHGPRTAFDLAICQQVAERLSGPHATIRPVYLPDEQSLIHALQTGQADLAPTLSSSQHPSGLTVGAPILADPVLFQVPLTTRSASALANKKVCFFAETPTEQILRTWFKAHHLAFLPFPFSEEGEMQAAFHSGQCAAIAADQTRLQPNLDKQSHLLPTHLAEDPMSPASRDPRLVQLTEEVVDHLKQTGTYPQLQIQR